MGSCLGYNLVHDAGAIGIDALTILETAFRMYSKYKRQILIDMDRTLSSRVSLAALRV